MRGCIQKFPDSIYKEIISSNDKHSLRSNRKGYGGKIHWTDSPNGDKTEPSRRELYYL
jgi:hypothetical protein